MVVTEGVMVTDVPVTVPTLGVRVRKLAPATDQARVVDSPPISVVGEA